MAGLALTTCKDSIVQIIKLSFKELWINAFFILKAFLVFHLSNTSALTLTAPMLYKFLVAIIITRVR